MECDPAVRALVLQVAVMNPPPALFTLLIVLQPATGVAPSRNCRVPIMGTPPAGMALLVEFQKTFAVSVTPLLWLTEAVPAGVEVTVVTVAACGVTVSDVVPMPLP